MKGVCSNRVNTKNQPVKYFRADKLNVKVYQNRLSMGQAAGEEVVRKLKELLKNQDSVRMVFASAPSQNEFLETIKSADIDWARVTAFHMDEYIGLALNHPQSFGYFLKIQLFDVVQPGVIHYINGMNDSDKEMERYSKLLQEAPIDIICLGIGENGHIAFNDPPVADFHDPYIIKMVELDAISRNQQVNDGCFAELSEVPTHALTLTIPTLMAGKHLYCMVPGPTKTNAVKKVLNDGISTDVPASILRQHSDCTLYLDNESYGEVD